MELTYRKAKDGDIEKIFLILKESAEWLNGKNIDYWQAWHNPPENFKDWIKEGFSNGEFYFVEYEEEIVGMYRLQYSDEFFWGRRDDKAGYIHSFTVRSKFHGRKIGIIILEHIEHEMIKNNINFLRLDCSKSNAGLCNYYKSYGFKETKTIQLFGDEMVLFEKNLN